MRKENVHVFCTGYKSLIGSFLHKLKALKELQTNMISAVAWHFKLGYTKLKSACSKNHVQRFS